MVLANLAAIESKNKKAAKTDDPRIFYILSNPEISISTNLPYPFIEDQNKILVGNHHIHKRKSDNK